MQAFAFKICTLITLLEFSKLPPKVSATRPRELQSASNSIQWRGIEWPASFYKFFTKTSYIVPRARSPRPGV